MAPNAPYILRYNSETATGSVQSITRVSEMNYKRCQHSNIQVLVHYFRFTEKKKIQVTSICICSMTFCFFLEVFVTLNPMQVNS